MLKPGANPCLSNGYEASFATNRRLRSIVAFDEFSPKKVFLKKKHKIY